MPFILLASSISLSLPPPFLGHLTMVKTILALFHLSLASSVSAWSTFVVPHSVGQDDTPSLTSVLANYSTNATILFKKGVTYNIFTPIKFPVLTNVEIAIEGNLTYPANISTVQGEMPSSPPYEWVLKISNCVQLSLGLQYVINACKTWRYASANIMDPLGLSWCMVALSPPNNLWLQMRLMKQPFQVNIHGWLQRYFARYWGPKLGLDWRSRTSCKLVPQNNHGACNDTYYIPAPVWKWWDAVQQVNRPHGISFSKINGGVIRDIKIWKVRKGELLRFAHRWRPRSQLHGTLQPVALPTYMHTAIKSLHSLIRMWVGF